MLTEQRIRAVLFYTSVAVFVIFLPAILSSALGYKFDRRNFKFTRTGLIFLKTQPPGASIYLDNKLLNEKTPTTINELLPGRYRVRLELERHYPWTDEVTVEEGKAAVVDRVILFLLRPNVKQLNKNLLSASWVDEERQAAYYVNRDDNGLYKSDLNGEHYERLSSLLTLVPAPLKYKVSLDRERLLYFNSKQLAITYINPDKKINRDASFVIDYPEAALVDAFWHSDGYHLIVVREDQIEVIEARPKARAVVLTQLNNKNSSAFYDIRNDTLYFLDAQPAADGNIYDNLYKIELSPWSFPWQDLMKRRSNEPKP